VDERNEGRVRRQDAGRFWGDTCDVRRRAGKTFLKGGGGPRNKTLPLFRRPGALIKALPEQKAIPEVCKTRS